MSKQSGGDVKKEWGDVKKEWGDVKKEWGDVKKEWGDVKKKRGMSKKAGGGQKKAPPLTIYPPYAGKNLGLRFHALHANNFKACVRRVFFQRLQHFTTSKSSTGILWYVAFDIHSVTRVLRVTHVWEEVSVA